MSHRVTRALAVFSVTFALLAPAAAGAEGGDDKAAAAYRSAYSLILEERWTEASRAFGDLVQSFPGSQWLDDAQFWACYARERAGEAAEKSFACYQELLARHPDSEWSDDARRNMVALARRLAAQGKPEYMERVRRFRDDEEDDSGLLAVLAALGHVGDEHSVDVILKRIDDTPDPQVRARIVGVLEDVESPRADAKLEELARSDPSGEVRAEAIEALGSRDSASARPLFQELAAGTTQPEQVRVAAVEALGELEDPSLVPFLLDLALRDRPVASQPAASRRRHHDEEPEAAVAEAAVEALAEIPGSEALKALITIFEQHPNREVRREVLDACDDREDDATFEFLKRVASRESDSGLAAEAAEAIGSMGGPRSLKVLAEMARTAETVQVRAAAATALAECDHPGAVGELATLLRSSSDTPVRVAAAEALGGLESDAGVEALERAAGSDPSGDVREAATHALGDIGTAAARDALIRLLGGKDGR